jgi:hypothetical protein
LKNEGVHRSRIICDDIVNSIPKGIRNGKVILKEGEEYSLASLIDPSYSYSVKLV